MANIGGNGMMNPRELRCVVNAFVNGAEVEYNDGSGWKEATTPNFDMKCDWRIKQHEVDITSVTILKLLNAYLDTHGPIFEGIPERDVTFVRIDDPKFTFESRRYFTIDGDGTIVGQIFAGDLLADCGLLWEYEGDSKWILVGEELRWTRKNC